MRARIRALAPALRRRVVRWGAGGLVALAAVAVVVRGQLASTLENRIARATGHRVTVGAAAFAAGGVAARDIVIFGAPPFDAEPLVQIDRIRVRLGGPRGLLSPSLVVVEGLDVTYLRAGSVDNVGAGAARPRGGSPATAGMRVQVLGGRLRGTIQPRQGPRLLLRARDVTGEVTAAGERTARLEGLVAEVAGWLTASMPQLTVKSEPRGPTVSLAADGATIVVPGGGPLVEELAVRGSFAPHRAEVMVTREPGVGRRTVPRVRAAFKLDAQGGQLAVDAAEVTLRPLHAWLDRLGLQVDATRTDLHLLASAEAGRPEIPFELDVRVRGFGVQNPSIDRRGWHDLPIELHAGGAVVAGAAGERGRPDKVRLDRGELEALGTRLVLSGWTELGPVPRGSWSVRTPPGSPLACGRLLPAQPLPVREALSGLKLAGSVGLSVSVGFDAAVWDSLSLDLGLDPLCEVVAEPRVLADILGTLVGGATPMPAAGASALALGRYHPDFAPLDKMPAHLPAAFLTAEDARFFTHGGFDLEMIRRALAHDLEMRSFAKGGSTITQQLAKNLFLPQSRTLARKLEETVLAWRLATLVPKKRMLELYLNIIELGPHIRGVKQAARAYFGKELGELRPIESAHLAALTPNPQGLARRFRDGRVDDGWMQRLYDLLGMMNRSGRLSRSDLSAARAGRLTLRKI
jgi:hypothetical protein